ncbi:helix-turn-helix transcriptional regulator [Pseudomonas sp. JM0905a]|uniref:Helix-turn-helix domain-containing protein n=1 Tax=Metapseudomonas resinovorans TaxID=53412 RepID=A0ABT4Y968_METRE|nr:MULTISPECIES: helix-turn-helix domain-containing protein [Pseudomonas]MBD2840357.1 helix-turn-helix transcriptional regulator [Pseudomonas sp. JM0905a]MDA8485422.1 helix-turn-helix domain-containing protein [Pseudomonas resinovorans]MDH4873416.1 helix-turn-helix transcriptional regulator [Pseudomonas sp. BN515]
MDQHSYAPVRTPEDLGKVVREARKKQHIRQEDMAMLIGKSHVHLRDIEKGKPTVSLGSVLQLLDELGIRVYLDVPKP